MLILQWTQHKYDTSPSEHTLYLCFDGWRYCILRHKEHNCYYRNYGQAIVNIIAGRYFHNWFIFIFLVIHTLNFRMICFFQKFDTKLKPWLGCSVVGHMIKSYNIAGQDSDCSDVVSYLHDLPETDILIAK